MLVKARLLLHQHFQPAGYVQQIGADKSYFIFSYAWIPHIAKIYVHWFEKLALGVKLYHINLLYEYLMRRLEEMK